MRAGDVLKIIGGKPIQLDLDKESSGELFFDTRSPKEKGIFLALHGEQRDGHDFASSSSAAFSIVSQPVDSPAILVPDVMQAAALLAKDHRENLIGLKVIAITGSQGKTTTKDMLKHLLESSSISQAGEVIAPIGSYNNDLGVPITLTSCNERTRFCITEMGARGKGDIARLMKIATPNISAVLKVGTAHLGEFGSREAIAETKSELIAELGSGGIAILGNYDEFTPMMAKGRNDLKVITFGQSGNEVIRATDIEMRGGFAHFELVTPTGREVVELRIAGEHNIANALAAAAIGYALNINENEIATALSTFEPVSKWRMELREIDGVQIINDSYNANPESMNAALKTLRLLAQDSGGRTFAFLGKMHELGALEGELHKEVGDFHRNLGIDYLISINEPRYLEQEGEDQILISSINEAKNFFQHIQPGDCVLFKASRAESLELLAEDFYQFLTKKSKSREREMDGNLS
jgi:UDP-N-acetylmuramoyl-tripeptide--D-alanyl-D-alanine ligase